jgi:hypothetical protein
MEFPAATLCWRSGLKVSDCKNSLATSLRGHGQDTRLIRMCSSDQTPSRVLKRDVEPFPFETGRSWDGRPVLDSAVLHPHKDIAQKHWSKTLVEGDHVVDATAGNGYDTLNLVRQISWIGGGILTACDIQDSAIEASKTLLREQLHMKIIEENTTRWICIPQDFERKASGSVILNWNSGCHLDFMKRQPQASVKLIVFNLGYLPGGDKSVTTLSSVTIATLLEATEVLEPGGCVSVTCYPGHEEGKAEEESVVSFAAALPQQRFSCYWHQWINQRNKRTGKPAPSLVLIQRL